MAPLPTIGGHMYTFLKNYKSTGVYGETIFRIHLNVWSNYYHFNNSVIQVYNKYT